MKLRPFGPALACALLLTLAACGAGAAPGTQQTSRSTADASADGATSEATDPAWVETVAALCTEQRERYDDFEVSAVGALLAVRAGDGFTPVPDSADAQAFDAALAEMADTLHAKASQEPSSAESTEALHSAGAAIHSVHEYAYALDLDDCTAIAEDIDVD